MAIEQIFIFPNEITFWSTMLSILFIPYAVVGAFILVLGRKQKLKKDYFYRATVSVCIPTYNEEKYIGRKLDNLLSQNYPVDEIVVYDCSTDRTLNIVEEYSAKDPRIKLVRLPHRISVTDVFNLAYKDVKSDIMIWTGCDMLAKSPTAVSELVANFADEKVGAVSPVLEKETGMEKYYRKIMTLIQTAESNIDSSFIAHASLLALRRCAISPVKSDSMAEDTEQFLLIRRKGYRTVIDRSVVTEEEIPSNFKLRRIQRDRRAQGIIKVIAENKDIFLNRKYGKFGLMVFPLELFILVVSPFLLLSVAGVTAYLLYIINPILASLGLLAIPLMVYTKKGNALFSIVDTQVSGLMGTLHAFSGRHTALWKRVR